MIFEHDIHAPHRDGSWLSGNVYRPDDSDQKPVPVITSLSAYNKEFHFTDCDPFEGRLIKKHTPVGVYERFDADTWVGFGYAVVHFDTPGSGLSPGVIDIMSTRDIRYYYDAIEWIAKQPWCNGKVASCGLSYHSVTSMAVATLQPPSLKAIIPWEVGIDLYRDLVYPGGIQNNFFNEWWTSYWIKRAQTGARVRPQEDLDKNYVDWMKNVQEHPHYDDFWKERSHDFKKINVPFYTVVNVCGHPVSTGSHFRLMRESSTPDNQKWLEIISGKHVAPMYETENIMCQKRFLDHFLKGVDNGQDKLPTIKYAIRGRYDWKSFLYDVSWPPAQTQKKRFLLNAAEEAPPPNAFSTIATAGKTPHPLVPQEDVKGGLPTAVTKYHNESDEWMHKPGFPYGEYVKNVARESKRPGSSVAFTTPAFTSETLLAGQSSVKLFVSLQGADDTDIFIALRYIAKNNVEVKFDGILDTPNLPVTYGYQRLSKRKMDPEISVDEQFLYCDGQFPEPVKEDEVVEVDIQLGPISVIVEKGGRLVLEISSRNVEDGYCYLMTCPKDRKLGGNVTIHTGASHPSQIFLPYQPYEVKGTPVAL